MENSSGDDESENTDSDTDDGSEYDDVVDDDAVQINDSDGDTIESDDENNENVDLVNQAATQNSFISKDNTVRWSSIPPNTGRTAAENLITNRPGITKYSATRIYDILSSFDLLFTRSMKAIVIENTNKYGRKNIRDWTDINDVSFDAFIGLLILAGENSLL